MGKKNMKLQPYKRIYINDNIKVNLIKEAKQVGLLYHIFDIEGLLNILKTKSLKGYNYRYISTTRNKNFNDYLGSRPSSYFKIELDGDKLSNKYKIEPYAYTSGTNITFEEYEEVIRTNEVKNIFQYVTKFIFLVDKFEKGSYSQKDVLLGKGYNIGYGKRFTIKSLKTVIYDIEKKIGKVYIQKGNRIYKDMAYFENLFKSEIED